jgi:hypothetical protein
MEKLHLPFVLDKDKEIERDEFFRIGGSYKYFMNN